MAARLSLEDKLAAIRGLRGQEVSPEQIAELRKYLADRSNFVVAAAAAIVGERGVSTLAGDLEAAYDRFLANPLKDDKLCRAKLAVVQALDRLEHLRTDVFERAATYQQHEPVFGGSEDTATTLRGAALIALARIEGTGALPALVDALIDPARDVRIAAAMAIGGVGGESAGLILRLKARVGDRDPDVLSECLAGLLTVNPRENLGVVCGFLDPRDEVRCEAAALALGKSRLPDALAPLAECWRRAAFLDVGPQVLLSIAMLRQPTAMDYLVGLVASESEKEALAALTALKMYSYDTKLRERLAEVVRQTGSRTIQARFERDFRASSD